MTFLVGRLLKPDVPDVTGFEMRTMNPRHLRPYLDLATKRPASWFEGEFRRWPFEPWAPVRRQTFVILNQVNRARKAAGLELIPTSCVRLKRRIYRPFAAPAAVGAASVGEGFAEERVALDRVVDL